jgi:hypothetical protein
MKKFVIFDCAFDFLTIFDALGLFKHIFSSDRRTFGVPTDGAGTIVFASEFGSFSTSRNYIF